MDVQEWNQIDGLVVSCTEALFTSMGLPLEHLGVVDDAAAPQHQTLGIMGFGGVQMRGALLLSADVAALAGTHPVTTSRAAVPEEELRDWSGELANQLLGRIKNQLLSYGLVIQLSTPTTISGLDLRLGVSTRNTLCLPHRFRTSGSEFQVRFEAVAESDVHFTAVAPADADIGAEGDMMMF